MFVHGNYFYGNEISEYGKNNGYVDYATLAKSFDAVLNNDIMQKTSEIGYWEPVGSSEEYYEDIDGNVYSYDEAQEKIEEINEKLEALIDEDEENSDEYRELEECRECLEDARYYEVYQWYIVSDNGASILEEAGEIVYYNEVLDMYVWGVTHWGTSWDYVLTNIRCNVPYEENE